MLQCQEGKRIYTTVYVVNSRTENLMGERDAVALGIITIRPKGDKPNKETVANITQVRKQSTPVTGKISGGQTQADIDSNVTNILEQFQDLFTGIVEVKLPPICIYMKVGARPMAHKLWFLDS